MAKPIGRWILRTMSEAHKCILPHISNLLFPSDFQAKEKRES